MRECLSALCIAQSHLCIYFSYLGVGFVGRHLTCLLVEKGLASHVRVVDKAPPATGWLNSRHKVSILLWKYPFNHFLHGDRGRAGSP